VPYYFYSDFVFFMLWISSSVYGFVLTCLSQVELR